MGTETTTQVADPGHRPAVAVVLPVRGEHDLLQEPLECLSAQRAGGFIVVIVDDDPSRRPASQKAAFCCPAAARGPTRRVTSGGDRSTPTSCFSATCGAVRGQTGPGRRSPPPLIQRSRWSAPRSSSRAAGGGEPVRPPTSRSSASTATSHVPGQTPTCRTATWPCVGLTSRRSEITRDCAAGATPTSWWVLARPGRRLVTIPRLGAWPRFPGLPATKHPLRAFARAASADPRTRGGRGARRPGLPGPGFGSSGAASG